MTTEMRTSCYSIKLTGQDCTKFTHNVDACMQLMLSSITPGFNNWMLIIALVHIVLVSG